MSEQEITHKSIGGDESFKFTQLGYVGLNQETQEWSYCNPCFSLRLLSDIDRIAELEKSRKSLIEEFAEARCLGEVAQIARGYGYDKNK
tara:strand:+ start:233 stop:499 length:267 start_codon:yes stop_codon:yes gene_type:complete